MALHQRPFGVLNKMQGGYARLKVMPLTCAAALAFIFIANVRCASARPLDEVQSSKTLRVVAYRDNKPFSYEDAQGRPIGIDVEIGKAIARELGVKAEIILRMPGETADDDVRANVWQGPRTGGGVGDIVLHVPYDREFRLRNTEVVIINPYFEERITLAVHPDLIDLTKPFTFDIFKKERKVGVQLATVADYFLMTFDDGALIENISHHTKPHIGVKEFANKEIAALMGVSSLIEVELHDLGLKAMFIDPDMPGIVRKSWIVGMAVHENSRDLGYAAGDVIQKLRSTGEMNKIFALHGIRYVSPEATLTNAKGH